MPVWIAEFLGALLRWALATLTGALVARSIIPQDVADNVVTHGVPTLLAWLLILIPLGLSWLQKWKARKVKLLALEMKPGTSEKELDAEAKRTIQKFIPPTAMLVILAIALSAVTIAASGCRSFTLPAKAKDVATVEQAAKCIALLGQTYETSMEILSELRAAGKISDQDWQTIADAQKNVELYGPQLVSAVETWRQFKSRSAFDTTYEKLKREVDTIAQKQAEVQ